MNTDPEIDVILNPPESKLRIEAENISIEVPLIGIVPRTPPRLVDRRFHSWSDHPVNSSSVPLDIFSVYELNLMNYLHCVTAILCSYFCPPPPHSPTTLQCNTLTDNLNEFDSKICYFSKKVGMVLVIMRPSLTEKFLRRFNVRIQHEKLRR